MTDLDFTDEEYNALPIYTPSSGERHYVDLRFTFDKEVIDHGDGDIESYINLKGLHNLQVVGLTGDDTQYIAENFAQTDKMQVILANDVGQIISDGGIYEY